MIRALLVALGTVFLSLAILGVVLPGLPTTPFVLLAAACYVRSSKRLYERLLHHRVFGKLIRDFQRDRAIPRSAKIASVAAMAGMVTVAVVFVVDALWLRVLLAALGAVGITVVLLFRTSGTKGTAS
ncbi:MAG: YbaN family protein [Spirochaetales bacterium]|nr:YbaN family protein [Spirochaetales bacterium]